MSVNMAKAREWVRQSAGSVAKAFEMTIDDPAAVPAEVLFAVRRVWDMVCGRKMAYVEVFSPESRAVAVVMKDLARFCRAHKSTFHVDPRAHAVMEGRREVWLRISEHLNLTDQQLLTLYGEE